jgi:uncharacterized protein YndB with AHSA1/START domain
MDILIIVGAALGLIIVSLIVFGFLSPRVARMNRSVEINAPVEKIWPQLISLKKFVTIWSPWTDKDPDAAHTYNDIPEGVGSSYRWLGDRKKVGEGNMQILEVDEHKKVITKIEFKGRGDALAGFHIESIGEGKSKVTWDFESDNKNNPVGRIFGRMMDKFLGPDYEAGLDKLKKHCEE